MGKPLAPEHALNLIEGALERLEVMKVLLFMQGVSNPEILNTKPLLDGLCGIFDAICDDIGDGHHWLTEAMKEKEAESHAR